MTLPPRPVRPDQMILAAEWEVRDYIQSLERLCDDLEGRIRTLSAENDNLIVQNAQSEIARLRTEADLVILEIDSKLNGAKEDGEPGTEVVEPTKPIGRPSIKTPAQEQTVLDHFKAHGVARIRELADLLQISRGTAHNWLKELQVASEHKCEHCGEPSVSQFCGEICATEHRKGEEFQ